MDAFQFETGGGSSRTCHYGHKCVSACPCIAGKVPDDENGCRGRTFEKAPTIEDIVLNTQPRPLDRPDPGCEAW